MKGHVMSDSLLTTHMSALHFVVELHLLGLHREKHTKTNKQTNKKPSGGVLQSVAVSKDLG